MIRSIAVLLCCVLFNVTGRCQDSSMHRSICDRVIKVIAKDYDMNWTRVSGICFRNVKRFVGGAKLNGFLADTAYVMANYGLADTAKSGKGVCLQHYFDTEGVDNNKLGSLLFLSPLYQGFLIARVARAPIIGRDDYFSASGRNTFYLMKFSKRGRLKKIKKYSIHLES